MAKCPCCGRNRSWQLSDGRSKCRGCGCRFRERTAWQASRLPSRAKAELVQRFAWGVPAYRQRFGRLASQPATEHYHRVLRACMAHAEQLRAPFEGALECDERTFSGARKGKRGWSAAGKVLVFGIVKRDGL